MKRSLSHGNKLLSSTTETQVTNCLRFLYLFIFLASLPIGLKAAQIFTCTTESGTKVFQETPCADSPSTEVFLEESEYPISQIDAGHSQPIRSIRNQNTNSFSLPSNRNAKTVAINFLKKRKAECGRSYQNMDKKRLENSARIVAKSKMSDARKDAAEISCHLTYLQRIEKVEQHGVLALSNSNSANSDDYGPTSNSSDIYGNGQNNNSIRQPGSLIDPFSGTVMHESGGGYVDPRNGTFHAKAGPCGVVNTRTGEFEPTTCEN